MISRETANLILRNLPTFRPRNETCAEVNPDLWAIWCLVQGRSTVSDGSPWTEYDVTHSCVLMLRKHLNELV